MREGGEKGGSGGHIRGNLGEVGGIFGAARHREVKGVVGRRKGQRRVWGPTREGGGG